MATKLIELNDHTFVEVEAQPNEVQQISSSAAERVEESVDVVKPVLVNACRPVVEAWRELSGELSIDQAEVQVGLGFEAGGNVYIAKLKGTANLTVTLTLKPKDSTEHDV